MKALTPIVLILISLGLFFWYIDPTYAHIRELQTQEATYDGALNKSKELQSVRDQLLSRYNTFDTNALTRLTKLLPDTVDNVRFLIDLDSIASRYGMRVKNASIDKAPTTAAPGTIGPDQSSYGSLQVSFSVSGTYTNFLAFLGDVEKSLRLVDVVGISFTTNDAGTYDYSVTIRTYWLR